MADTAREKEIARENAERYVYARDNGHMRYVKKARICEAFFEGYENKQWDELVAKRLLSEGKPVLTINKILPTIGNVMGEQLQNQSDISFRPTASGNPETAMALDKLWVHVSNTQRLDWTRAEVADNGFITSRGFYDVRVGFDDNMRGEVRITSKNPKNIIIDPFADSYDPAGWSEVFESRWMSPNQIETLYSKDAANILRTRSPSEHSFGFDFVDYPMDRFGNPFGNFAFDAGRDNRHRKYIRVIERQYKELKKQLHFVDPTTGDMRAVPDNWSKRRVAKVAQEAQIAVVERVVERIKWTTTADDILLFDNFSPMRYFTIVPYFPYFRHGSTIGLVENLLSPQENLNKARSQELHIINSTANGGWKVKSGSLVNMDIQELEERGSETGVVLELSDVNDAEKISPNQIPSGLDRSSFKADEDVKEISGVGDSQRGLDRADVSGKAIQAKQIRGSVNLAKPFANLIRTDHLLATRVLDIVQTFYTEERVLQITSKGPGRESEQVIFNEITAAGEIINDLTAGEYDVITTTVPAREQHEDTQFEQALLLKQQGLPIPDEVLIEHSKLFRKAEILEKLKAGPSPEEQELQQLEIAERKADISAKEAEATSKKADAAMKMATMAKSNADTAGALNGLTPELTLQKQISDDKLALERELANREYAFKREELRRKDAVERAKLLLEKRKLTQARSTASGG